MKLRKETNRIIIHHSLSPRDRTTVEDLRKWHVDENGWEDIGYHFFVNGSGTMYNCRPLVYQGAHARGKNHDSIGVCLAGDFNKEVPSYKQLKGLINVVNGLNMIFGVLPVCYHRETKDKCPGKYFQNMSVFSPF